VVGVVRRAAVASIEEDAEKRDPEVEDDLCSLDFNRTAAKSDFGFCKNAVSIRRDGPLIEIARRKGTAAAIERGRLTTPRAWAFSMMGHSFKAASSIFIGLGWRQRHHYQPITKAKSFITRHPGPVDSPPPRQYVYVAPSHWLQPATTPSCYWLMWNLIFPDRIISFRLLPRRTCGPTR
jgi:hypothetical protein